MSDLNNREKFLAKISAGGVCFGTGVWLSDATVSELLAEAGFDFTWIDLEHSAMSAQAALGHVMAARGTHTAPFVRVAWNDPVLIKPVLEMSPAGIIVPMVCSAEEAARAVAACKYPPAGTRGFGPARGMRYGAMSTEKYLRTADSETLILLQIEHARALSQMLEIIDTPGVDGICVGPYDLSGSMGKLGQVDDPQVRDAVGNILRATRRAGKLAGIASGADPESLRRWMDAGAQWINIGGDIDQLFSLSRTMLDSARATESSFARSRGGGELKGGA